MATSAFKSTTKRLSIGGGGSGSSGSGSSTGAADDSVSSSITNKTHRRSRSLSVFSRRLPSELEEEEETRNDYRTPPRGKFVNTVRGSEFPEISLDDLALEFFSSSSSKDDNKRSNNDEEIESGERGRSRSSRRGSQIGRWASDTESSKRRGRSVSRPRDAGEATKVVSNGAGSKAVASDANSRRRRSVSVARRRFSDAEGDAEHIRSSHSHYDVKNISSWNGQTQKTPASADRRLRKSLSQKDLAHLHDGYSSQSSALTDDETKDAQYGKKGDEMTIRTVYAQKVKHPNEGVVTSGLYEAMRKELRYAVEEIRTELEQAMVRDDEPVEGDSRLPSDKSDGLQVFSAIRKSYATKLEQSQKRKQDLLAEMLFEEQRGRELSKIVKELLPDLKNSSDVQKPAQARKRSTDRNSMSRRLTEEAERYIEDFISNVEDTDISSFDGERSDGSSTLGGTIKPRDSTFGVTENFQSPEESNPRPVEMDGVILPWLQWETSNDGSLIDKNKIHTPITPKTLQWNAEQDIALKQDPSNYSISSHGSSSTGYINNRPMLTTNQDKGEKSGICQRSSFDMSEYLMLRRNEEVLFERYNERHRLHSGGLLLCTNVL
ncbi:hypothetical protein ACH5RR_025306 [Cinchona calisaya]|uniref:Uncharacterized protein n=1 Tax=Cinchona calisaya TaxID=153742 RepID=A0ABD2Z1R4_9GENT